MKTSFRPGPGAGPEARLRRLDSLLAVLPGDTGLLRHKAATLRRLGRPQAAVALLARLLPQHPDDPELRMELALACRAAGDIPRCLQLLAAVLQRVPGHGPALRARVDIALQAGQLPEALQQTEAALQHLPDDLTLQLQRGRLLRQLQRHADSVAHLRALRARRPGTLPVLRELVLACRMAGDCAASLQFCARILQLHPLDRAAWQARIDTCIYFQRLEDALRHTEAAWRLFPDDLSLRLGKGRLLRQLQRLQASRRHLEMLLALHPDDPAILHELSVTCRMLGDDRRSLQLCDQLLAASSDDRAAHVALVDTCLHFRLPERAQAALEVALRLWPGDTGLQVKQAAVLRQLQRPAEARARMAALLARDPGHLAARHELALACRMTGDYAASLAQSAAILRVEPAHRAALLARIDTAVHFQLHDTALDFAEQALKRLPLDPGLRLKKGSLLRLLQRHAEGIAWLQKLREGQPGNLALIQELALSLRMAGDYAGAQQLTDRLLQEDPFHREARIARIDMAIHLSDLVALEQECDRALQDLCAASADDPAPARQALVAQLLVRALTGLPPALARPRLEACGGPLLAAAAALPGPQLWGLYELADLLGLGAEYRPCLDLLLHRPVIGGAEARQILIRAFQLDLPGWKDLLARLGPRIPEGDRPLFDLDAGALTGGAEAALAGRRRAAGRRRPAAEIQLLARLLQQTGRRQLAARYLGLAARARPDSRVLFQEHVIALIGLGRATRAQALLQARRVAEPDPAPQWLAVLAYCLAELGQLQAARALFDRITHPQLRAGLQAWHIRLLHGLGDSAAAAAAVQAYRGLGSQKQALHFLPSLSGLLDTDAAVAGLADGPGDAAEAALIAPALQTITSWRQASAQADAQVGAHAAGSAAPVPRQILQYWNSPVPPADIGQIMQSWQQAEGFCYRAFNRETARQYLLRHLGPDWAKALRNAGSPAEESDYFRLCHLMLEGGIYADCDDWLQGDAGALLRYPAGLVLFVEPFGTLANNVMIAAPRHPVIVWAAAAARRALLERHNDSTWAKVGPGLLTRAVAWYLRQMQAEGRPPDMALPERWELGAVVQYHTPLPYKRSKAYWNAQSLPGGVDGLAAFLARPPDLPPDLAPDLAEAGTRRTASG